MNRSRSAIWNYLSALLFTAVTLIGLWSTRYVLQTLGTARLGAFKMLTDWLGYLNLIELGLTGAMSPMLARALAEKDRDRSTATLTIGLQVFLLFGGLTLFCACVMWIFIGWLIPVEPGDQFDLRLAWGISLVSLLPMMVAPFRALADAGQRGYRINLALSLQSVMIFGLSVTFAWIGWGISGQALAVTCATLPLVLMLTYEGMRHKRGLFHSALTTRPDLSVGRDLLALAVPTFLISLSGRISVLTDSLVVGNILGTDKAAILGLTLKLVLMAQGQLQGIGAASWAALAELHNQNKRDDFNRRLVELTGVVALLAVSALGPILAYNHHFIAIWVGSSSDAGDAVVLVGCINALLLGLFSLWFWCFTGTGQVRRMVPVTLMGAIINLTASVAFTHAFGIIGPLLGSTLAFVSLSLWILPRQLHRTFGTPIGPLFRAWLVPLAWGVPYAALLWWLSHHHTPWGLVGVGFEMGCAAVGFLVLGGLFILTPEARAVWVHRIASALPRFRRDVPPVEI